MRNRQTKPEQPALTPCKYAGDPNDEYCKNCNGVEMMVDNKPVPANQCGGYEVEAAESADGAPVQPESPVSQEELVEYTGTHCAICNEPQFNTNSGVSCKNGHGGSESFEDKVEREKAQKEQAEKAKQQTQQADAATNAEIQGTYVPKATTTSIKAESGVSVEIKDNSGKTARWYKFTYTEERNVPADADVEKEKEILWNDVNATVDGQVEETLSFLQSK
jgi:uncharacterized Zn finger protein (UPF0148 family)